MLLTPLGSAVCYLLAFCLLIGVAVDSFITVFSTSGAGFITRFWTDLVWKAALAVHQRRRIHGVLAFIGPLMLIGVILVWYFLLSVGCFLLYLPVTDSIVDNTKATATTPLEKLYFVGTTISSLGYGDYVPSRFPWTVISTSSALVGTIILTTSLSYVLAVLSAGIERKFLAEGIFGIGNSVEEFLDVAWGEEAHSAIDSHLLSLASMIDAHAHKHLTYPILFYFHSARKSKSPSRAVLLFSDAVFLATNAISSERQPPKGVAKVIKSSIHNFADLATIGREASQQNKEQIPESLKFETLQQSGLPIVPEEYEAALEDYLTTRSHLLLLCREDGWFEE